MDEPLSNPVLRILEEFIDGFLILNHKNRILYFNEGLLRMTGLRSADILRREEEFLKTLGIGKAIKSEKVIKIPLKEENPATFVVSTLPVVSENGSYLLVKVKYEQDSKKVSPLFGQDIESLINNLGDPVLAVDLCGQIHAANPSFHKLIELDPGDALPEMGSLYVFKSELEDKILRLVESDAVFNLETHLYAKSKQIKRILDTSWAIRDKRGVMTGYTSHFKDVTYLKNLESRLQISERNYIALFGTILSSIILVDPLRKILNCNYGAEGLYGYKWTEIAGKDFDSVFRVGKNRPWLEQIISLVDQNNGRYVETDVPRLCKDGTVRFTYACYTAVRSTFGEVVAYCIMEKDLTERVRLEKKLQESFQAIKETQSAAILGFARLTEYRDKNTGKHLERIREYTRVIATGLRKLPQYSDYITDEYIEDLCLSSVLHDVGKVGIEDAILLKQGKLDTKEFARIKAHAELGGNALKAVDRELKRESFLTIGKEIAFYHHEWWDGTGYPEGKKSEQIPLSARIVSLADVYDALTSKRSYKDQITHEKAVEIIAGERGTHFDPDILDVFLENEEVFNRIKMLEAFQQHPESIDDLIQGDIRQILSPGSGESETQAPAV